MKSKKILTILLSLAIMFTFMPAMAFADTQAGNGVWNDTFTVFTPTGEAAVAAKTASTGASDGLVTKVAAWTPAAGGTEQTANAYYYDMTGAVVSVGQDAAGNISLSAYNNLFANGSKKEVTAFAYNSTTKAAYETKLKGWKAYVTGEQIESLNGNQQVVLPVTFESTSTQVNAGTSPDYPALLNAENITVTLNVRNTPVPTAYTWIIDGSAKKVYSDGVDYDGAEHEISLLPVEGYTVGYEKFDSSSAKWTAVSKITVKDVEDSPALYRGSYYKNGSVYKIGDASFDQKSFVVKPAANLRPTMAFSSDVEGYVTAKESSHNRKIGYFVVAEGYDPMSYVEITPKNSTARAKAVVAANEETLKAFFADFCEFKTTKKAAYPEYDFVEIAEKDLSGLSAAEKKALATKYIQILKNFGMPTNVTVADLVEFITNGTNVANDHRDIADVFVEVGSEAAFTHGEVVNEKDDDITFSGVTKKTYKAKKSTKKLAKAKSFTVKAVADSGNAIKFSATSTSSKIKINATTGKVTVKKGLKKGTYKITVKAKTAAGNGYKACKESKTYTIKVK